MKGNDASLTAINRNINQLSSMLPRKYLAEDLNQLHFKILLDVDDKDVDLLLMFAFLRKSPLQSNEKFE